MMARRASSLRLGSGGEVRWRGFVIALLAAVPLATAALAQSALAKSVPSGTLRVGMQAPAKLDPAYASSGPEIAVLNAVYDYLVDVDANNAIQPRLATSWQVARDGLNYTFHLAPNAKWHDGSPVTAPDVVYTFNRLRDPKLKLPTADLYADIASVEASGAQEVTFTLKHANPFSVRPERQPCGHRQEGAFTQIESNRRGAGSLRSKSNRRVVDGGVFRSGWVVGGG